MPTTLQWQVSLRVSYLHAAAAMLDGKRVVDATLADALAGPVERLGRAIAAADLPRERFLRHLSALAIELENKTQIAETALTKTIGRGRVSQAAIAEWTSLLSSLTPRSESWTAGCNPKSGWPHSPLAMPPPPSPFQF